MIRKAQGSILLEFGLFMIVIATVVYGGFLSVAQVSNRELTRSLRKRLFYDGANYWND